MPNLSTSDARWANKHTHLYSVITTEAVTVTCYRGRHQTFSPVRESNVKAIAQNNPDTNVTRVIGPD